MASTAVHGTLTVQQVSDFVERVCRGRSTSHGAEHMKKVMNNAVEIWEKIGEPRPRLIDVQIVALLHDVADHKYDNDGVLQDQVRDFLLEHGVPDPYAYINTINAISFSKEKKAGKRWFEAVLEPYWVKIRDIVSDADKWEALGEEGGRRCMQYAEEVGAETDVQQVQHLLQHMHDKLLKLKTEYIVTIPGQERAEHLQDELVHFAVAQTMLVL